MFLLPQPPRLPPPAPAEGTQGPQSPSYNYQLMGGDVKTPTAHARSTAQERGGASFSPIGRGMNDSGALQPPCSNLGMGDTSKTAREEFFEA